MDIVHRNLKPSNILLLEPFDFRNPRKALTLKITDFDDVKKHTHTTTMSFVGTITYMAPEVLQNQHFSKASDVWSFGVLIWEMLSGDIPHKGLQALEIISKSQRGVLENLPIAPSFPEDYKLILTRCWKSTCEDRLSVQQILDILDPPEVFSLASLHQDVFVSRRERSVIEVYDSTTFSFRRRMVVDGMYYPGKIASCTVNNCLYVAESRFRILRIDPFNGNVMKSWESGGRYCQLSVASDTNVIACPFGISNLYEFTSDGEFIRCIQLCQRTRYIDAACAVKLDNGLFIVCQLYPSGIFLFSTKETACNLRRVDEIEILRKFSKEMDGFGWPISLSVDKKGLILVLDAFYHRAMLLNFNFDKAQILISEEDGMESPKGTCFNESTGEWLVTSGYRIFACRLEGETIERQIHNLISH